MPSGKRATGRPVGRPPNANAETRSHKAKKPEREERARAMEALKVRTALERPSWLTPLAKKEWDRVMKLYGEMEADILSALDVAALVAYCEAWAIYRTAQKDWKAMKATVSEDRDTQRMINQTIKTMNEQTQVISRLSEQLCLTPVGRARMGMNPARQKKPGDRLLEVLGG